MNLILMKELKAIKLKEPLSFLKPFVKDPNKWRAKDSVLHCISGSLTVSIAHVKGSFNLMPFNYKNYSRRQM